MATLSVIVPLFNEAAQLRTFVERLISPSYPIEREFIFVDDGSQDDTLSLITRLSQDDGSQDDTLSLITRLSQESPSQVIRQDNHQGKGAAVRRGIEVISGDFRNDSRRRSRMSPAPHDPRDVPTLLRPLLDNQADVVYGSRFNQNSPVVHRTYHYLANRFLTSLSNCFSGIYLSDMETCYKIFRADLIKSMNLISRRFEIEVELTAYIAKTSARIYELPISYRIAYFIPTADEPTADEARRKEDRLDRWIVCPLLSCSLQFLSFFRTEFHRTP